MNLKLDKIIIDNLQARAATDESTIAEYSEAWLEGEKFPDVIVFHDGSSYFLADGFHRYFGALKAGLKDINADVRKGGRKEALWFAVAANRTHGLKRTNADKRKAVEIALREKPEMADNAIAKHIGVSQPLVSDVRRQLQVLEVESVKIPTKRVGLDGKERKSPVVPPPSKPAEKPASKTPIPAPSKKVDATTPPPLRVEKKPEPVAPPITPDEIGRAVPDALLGLWERRHETKELVTLLSSIRSKLKNIPDNDPLYAFINVQSALTAIDNTLQAVKLGMPYSLCPTCHGKNIEPCTVCRHTGFISKLAWDATTAEETKQQILGTLKK